MGRWSKSARKRATVKRRYGTSGLVNSGYRLTSKENANWSNKSPGPGRGKGRYY